MEDEDEEELVERLECEIEMENGRWKWRRVSGEIRMGDRVSGKIRMGDRWVDYKRRKKWAWGGIFWGENLKCLRNFFEEKILDVWESFGRLKKNLREKKYQKRERILKMIGV